MKHGRNPYEFQVNSKCEEGRHRGQGHTVHVVIPMSFRSIQSVSVETMRSVPASGAGRNPYEFQVNSKVTGYGVRCLAWACRNPYEFQVNSKLRGYLDHEIGHVL